MALSEQLAALTARAKQAEERAAAAQHEARAKLEGEVKNAQSSLQSRSDELKESAQANQGKVANWWSDVQKGWDEQIASIRRDVDTRKAEHDLHAAQRAAISADEDARFSIEYAYWAVEQAEYAVLDAILARMDADSLAGAPTTT